MSISISTTSRFGQNTDINNNTESPSLRQVTAADRAARRAKRAERLALQTESTKGSNETKTEPKNIPFTIKISNVTLNDKKTEEKSDSIRNGESVKKKDSNGNASVNISCTTPKEEEEREKKPDPVKNDEADDVFCEAPANVSVEQKVVVKPAPGAGVRGRINTWTQPSVSSKPTPRYGAAAGTSKFQFGVDYSKKTRTSISETTAPRRIAPNKYTPTINKRPYSTGFIPSSTIGAGSNNTGRFQGIQKDEPNVPSFGDSPADRMAKFREAMEKEKTQKAKEEERKKQAEEKKKETLEKRKQEEEKRKQEELEKKAEEEKKALEAKAEEEEKASVPDSEKIKRAAPCKKKEKKPARRTMSISNIVIDWVQEMTKDYPVEIKNFSTSWANGMAFCALIHKFNPDEFDFYELKPENRRYNFDLAFNTGAKVKKIPILLDTNDMVRMKRPEPRSVQCYIQWIWSVYGPTSGYGPTPEEVQNADVA